MDPYVVAGCVSETKEERVLVPACALWAGVQVLPSEPRGVGSRRVVVLSHKGCFIT